MKTLVPKVVFNGWRPVLLFIYLITFHEDSGGASMGAGVKAPRRGELPPPPQNKPLKSLNCRSFWGPWWPPGPSQITLAWPPVREILPPPVHTVGMQKHTHKHALHSTIFPFKKVETHQTHWTQCMLINTVWKYVLFSPGLWIRQMYAIWLYITLQ